MTTLYFRTARFRITIFIFLVIIVTSFSKLHSQGSFPFQLTEFKAQAKNGNVGLTWKTKSQEDLLQFEVEYSPDGKYYKRIDVVPASGSPNGDVYESEHSVSYSDSGFYRLKMVDNNRKWQYSDPIIVRTNKITSFFVYPSVITTHVMNIFITDPFNSLEVVSMNGTMMLKENLSGKTGRINIPLSTNLGAGMYIVQLRNQDQAITQKVIIQ
jgi:hypothetical protein